MLNITPFDIVIELNKFIVGQEKAKRVIAIALRNRWRRNILPDDIKTEITPKNILLVGPTGVGKTEIARRIANLTNSPFIKVEATNFTEVGYVGKEVDSIIRELTEKAIQIVKYDMIINHQVRIKKIAEDKIISILLSNIKIDKNESYDLYQLQKLILKNKQFIRKQLLDGSLDDQIIEIKVDDTLPTFDLNSFHCEDHHNPLHMFLNNYTNLINAITNKDKRSISKNMKIKDALNFFIDEEFYKLLNNDIVKIEAIKKVEEEGIVFIDEIDKICKNNSIFNTADISGEGVQRDLLPLLEGCIINTKYGLVRTDNILFIAAGAFHSSNPSYLIPELQGRLPIQVKLDALTVTDFQKILSSTSNSLIVQYQNLLKTEDFNLIFTQDGINRIAEIAWYINEFSDNIGARRLKSIFEKLLENISFDSYNGNMVTFTIDKKYVDEQLSSLIPTHNVNKFII